MTLLAVLRVLTTVAAVMVGLSPLPDFWRIHKTRCTGDVSILPIALLFCNCYMWAMYGFMVGNIFPVFVVNLFGMLTSVGFSAVYYRWSTERPRVHQLWARASVVLAIGTFYRILGGCGATNQSADQVAATLGFMSVGVNIALYASPLANMKTVIQTKNAASLPISISAVFLGNAILWVIYAFAVSDMFVLVPNTLGMALCTAQVALYVMYRPGRGSLPETDECSGFNKHQRSAEGPRTYWGRLLRLVKNPQGYEMLGANASVAPLPK
ncbi:hypothetical protein BBJ28_00015426 [Nothophytophthora sp. Chile5]|nr:hypothetical protein BBJ28_00015426 [Nothophytophthora sp. Chile5]